MAAVSWVAAALDQAGLDVEGRLSAVRHEPLARSGVFGQVERLLLSYEPRLPGDPGSLILKLPAPSASNHARAVRFGLYEREVGFYRDVAESLKLRVPRCYRSEPDPDSEGYALLLEDLGQLDMDDDLRGIAPGRVRLTVEQLAGAHAQWWESPRLAELDWLPLLWSPVMEHLAEVFRDSWPDFLFRMGEGLPAGAQAVGEAAQDRFVELLEALSRPPVTIVHADLRPGNLLFGHSGRDAVAVIDWQLAVVGRGTFDIAHLLCQSMTVEQRRRHELSILRGWHDALLRSGVKGYSWRDAVADYKRAALVCLGYVVAGAALDRRGEEGRAVAREQAVRAFTAALDLNVAGERRRPATSTPSSVDSRTSS